MCAVLSPVTSSKSHENLIFSLLLASENVVARKSRLCYVPSSFKAGETIPRKLGILDVAHGLNG